MKKSLEFFALWVIVMILTIIVAALFDSFVRLSISLPWEWGKPGRIVIAGSALFWAWTIFGYATDDKKDDAK